MHRSKLSPNSKCLRHLIMDRSNKAHHQPRKNHPLLMIPPNLPQLRHPQQPAKQHRIHKRQRKFEQCARKPFFPRTRVELAPYVEFDDVCDVAIDPEYV